MLSETFSVIFKHCAGALEAAYSFIADIRYWKKLKSFLAQFLVLQLLHLHSYFHACSQYWLGNEYEFPFRSFFYKNCVLQICKKILSNVALNHMV